MPDEPKPLSSHVSERTLYQVQVCRRKSASSNILLNEKFIGTEWERLHLNGMRFRCSDHEDTQAELDDGLFPYALAMSLAWEVASVEHAFAFKVRLVPYLVKTSYASYPQEPMEPLERHAP